jgi:carboxyl-terminal processing protease
VVLRLSAVVDDAEDVKATRAAGASSAASSDPASESIPEEPPPSDPALTFVARGEQVVIDHIAPGTPSARAGLQIGDVLLGIDGVPVRSAAQARGLLQPSAAHGTMVVFDIRRAGHGFRIRVATR